MRTSVLDSPDIGQRGRQIAAEERRAILEACDCPATIDAATGRPVKQHQSGCRHYVDPYYGCGLAPACPAAFLLGYLGPSMRPIGVRRESLRERLAELGVRVIVTSRPGNGT